MKKFKSHEITVKGTLGVTAINVKTVEDVEKAVQQIAPANYSEVSTKDGEYGIIEIHKTENGEYRYILTYNGENPYDATILDEYNKIIGYVQITDEEIDEVAENYEKAQKKVEIIGGRFYTKKDVVKSRKVNCTLGRSVYKDVHFTERVEISKEEAEEILKNYGFTAESYIAYKNGDRTEEKAEVEVEEYAITPEAQEVAIQAEIDNAEIAKKFEKAVAEVKVEIEKRNVAGNPEVIAQLFLEKSWEHDGLSIRLALKEFKQDLAYINSLKRLTAKRKAEKQELEELIADREHKIKIEIAVGKKLLALRDMYLVMPEDDGSNDDDDEEFLSTLDISVDYDNDDDELVDEPEPTSDNITEVESAEKWHYYGYDYHCIPYYLWSHKFIYGGEITITSPEDLRFYSVDFQTRDNNKISVFFSLIAKVWQLEKAANIADSKFWSRAESAITAKREELGGKLGNWRGMMLEDNFDAYFKTKEAAFEYADFAIEYLTTELAKVDAAILQHFTSQNIDAADAEEKAEDYAITPEVFEVAVQAEIENASTLRFDLQAANNVEEPEKIFVAYVSRFDGLSYHRKGEKFFNNATDAFNYLAKKHYKNDNFEFVIEVWDSEEDYYKYSGYGAFEEEHKIYTNSPDFGEYSTNAEIQKLIEERDAKAEVESTEVVKDDEKDFLDLLESETADSAVEKPAEEVIECKPKLADKPYTCVTKRVGDFFNPKKFFDTLNDAVRYALVDKSKRMDWDERYNGAAVCLVYENGMCRPIWEITAEGKFEMVDASEDYGELDNDAVKAELANIDTAQSINIEKDIVETLNEIKYCNQDIERAKSRMENAKYWGKTEDVSIAEKDLLKEEKAKAKELSKLAEFSTNYPKIYAKAIKAEKEKYGAYFNRTYSGIATIES